jgi:hypothetical protein
MFESFRRKSKETEPVLPSKAEMEERAAEYAKENGKATFSAKDLIEVEEQQKAFDKNGWNAVGEDKAFKKENGGDVDGTPIEYTPVKKDDQKAA